MKLQSLTILIFLQSFIFIQAWSTGARGSGSDPDILNSQILTSSQGLIQRLLPQHADKFRIEVIPQVDGRDVFELESQGNLIIIRGNNGVSIATGLNWYLKNYCHCSVSLHGNQLRLPDLLPSVMPKVRQVTWTKYRYFLNYCAFGYSLVWWDWEQWEKLIDWMALNGVNLPLAVTGQEAVRQNVYRKLGMSVKEIADYLAGPPYLPFQWMGCLDGWGGPLPQSWIDDHVELQHKILARERELGMTPILQGFSGHVPQALTKKFPDAKMNKLTWIKEFDTFMLDPLDPLFSEVAKLYIEEQTRLFGTDHFYAADPFIEMTPPSGEHVYLGQIGKAIFNGMYANDQKAVWIMQSWSFWFKREFWTQDRVKAIMDAIPNDHLLVLDLFCEQNPLWNKTEAFYGKPWVWCNIQNFGNKVVLGGPLSLIATDLPAVRQDPQKGQLTGLGFVNEGLDYNPVVQDLMFEMAWHDNSVDLETWISDYIHNRYGKKNANAEEAWQNLSASVFNKATANSRSAFAYIPTLKKLNPPQYDNAYLTKAWKALLEASSELGDEDTYKFDLVNITRQALSNYAFTVHSRVIESWESRDKIAFKKASKEFVQLMKDMDKLLATNQEFLLGSWLEDAKRWGTNPVEQSKLQWNARYILTLWSPKGINSEVNDYARKEWAGLISGYYLPRWEQLFKELSEDLNNGKTFDQAVFREKLGQWTKLWCDNSDTYTTEPKGNTVIVAKKLWKKYKDSL